MIKAIHKENFNEIVYTEPCMNCFGYFEYSYNDMTYGFIEGLTAAQKFIICPHCGKQTIVHGHNIQLC